MRKNAAGLASVCILSTMVLVTMATTVALQRGTTARLDSNYPTDYSAVAYFVLEKDMDQYPPIVQKIKEQTKGQLKDVEDIFKRASFRATYGEWIRLCECELRR